MNIIEPCCAERQLGQLLREAHGHAALFQTNGDVTAKLFIKDTMLLSGDRPRTLTIAASEMPQEAMRLISRYASLGYIATLRLMLPSDLISHFSSLISHLSSLISHFDVELALLPDNKPIPELMMWRGSSHTVVIQGTMPDTVSPALHLYAGMLCGNQSLTLRAATDAFEALFRARRVEVNHGDWNNDSSEAKIEVPVPGDSQQTKTAATSDVSPQPIPADAPTRSLSDIAEPKKKSNRKKAKKNEVEPTKQVETAPSAEENTEATA